MGRNLSRRRKKQIARLGRTAVKFFHSIPPYLSCCWQTHKKRVANGQDKRKSVAGGSVAVGGRMCLRYDFRNQNSARIGINSLPNVIKLFSDRTCIFHARSFVAYYEPFLASAQHPHHRQTPLPSISVFLYYYDT